MADSEAPWVEKYRPQTIDDICHQEAVKESFKNIVKGGKMPHLLLYGPPGTGKTTAILALCRALYGKEWKKRVKELNASDDRGIKAVRGTIKGFAGQTPASIQNQSKVPNFKICILDEADMMTIDAQSCLRRIMEEFSTHTRFVLICNYVSSIISPIQSRCAGYRFEPISQEAQLERIKDIAKNEVISIQENAIRRLIYRSGGDMRLAITTLYTIHCSGTKECSDQQVDSLMGYPPPAITDKAIHVFTNKSSSRDISKTVEDIVADGYDVELLLNEIGEHVFESGGYRNVQKAMIAQYLASAQVSLTNGAKEYTALMAVALQMNAVCVSK